MIDVPRLRTLRTVVQVGSVHRAAQLLGLTPSAVSQQLSTLQRETGLTLLERDGRGIVPTAAGRLLAQRARGVLERVADLDALAEDLRSGRIGTLSVECFHSANRAWLPHVAATLRNEFPEVRLDVSLVELKEPQTRTEPDLQLYIAESGAVADLAAVGGSDGYVTEHLVTERYVAVVSAYHQLASRSSVSIRELADEPWVDNDHSRGPCRAIVLAACAGNGFTPRFSASAPDYATAFDYVAAGLGVTVVPRLGAFRLPGDVVAVPVSDEGVQRTIMRRTKYSMRSNAALQRAHEVLRRCAAEHAGAAERRAAAATVSPAAAAS